MANGIKVLEAQLAQSSNTNMLNERLILLKKTQRGFTIKPPSDVLAAGLKDASLEGQLRILRVLSRRGESYERVEPILLAHLKSPTASVAENAVICLKNYGTQASNALSQLQTVLTHRDPRVREAASNAINRIAVLAREQSVHASR